MKWLPDKVTVSGRVFHVSVCDTIFDREGDGCCGVFLEEEGIILLARTVNGERMTKAQMLDTLVHEMTHAAIAGPVGEAFVGQIGSEVARALTRNGLTRRK